MSALFMLLLCTYIFGFGAVLGFIWNALIFAFFALAAIGTLIFILETMKGITKCIRKN